MALVMAMLAGLAIPSAGCVQEAPRTHRVRITDMRFTPSTLVVRPGDSVQWVNEDLVPHTVTSRASGIDSGTIPPGGDWRWTAREPLTMPYTCALHPTMTARLDVR